MLQESNWLTEIVYHSHDEVLQKTINKNRSSAVRMTTFATLLWGGGFFASFLLGGLFTSLLTFAGLFFSIPLYAGAGYYRSKAYALQAVQAQRQLMQIQTPQADSQEDQLTSDE